MKSVYLALLPFFVIAGVSCSSDPGTPGTDYVGAGGAGSPGYQLIGGNTGVPGPSAFGGGGRGILGGSPGSAARSGAGATNAGAFNGGLGGTFGAGGPSAGAPGGGIPVTSGGVPSASGVGGVSVTNGGVPSASGVGGGFSSTGGSFSSTGGGFSSTGGSFSNTGSSSGRGGTFPANGGRTSTGGVYTGGSPGNTGGSHASGGTPATGGSPAVCTASIDHQCVGADLQVCRADGQGFRHQQTCASTPLCNAILGVCLPTQCTPGQATCDGDYLRICNNDGTAYDATLCPMGCDSVVNNCALCRAGSRTCDGLTSVICDDQGHSLTRNVCPVKCFGAGICGECDPSSASDCAPRDPCEIATCDPTAYVCTASRKAVNDTCSMQAGYGTCTAGGCPGFCTDRDSCDPVVVIKANVNGMYVSLTSNGSLLANASKSNAARFALHINPLGFASQMAFYSMDVGSYVTGSSPTDPLQIGAGAIGSGQVFSNYDGNGNYDSSNLITDVTMSFWSSDAKKFVTAEDGGNSPLIANRDNVGPWEQFTLENAPY